MLQSDQKNDLVCFFNPQAMSLTHVAWTLLKDYYYYLQALSLTHME